VVIEITSQLTKREDLRAKWVIYLDILKVSEYFLFDPKAEYLDPPLQGYRLIGGEYVPIETVAGQLPSVVPGLCLERDGTNLRLLDPTGFQRLLTPREAAERRDEAAEAARRRGAEEIDRLRREIEALRLG
jgi:hypothetical protein